MYALPLSYIPQTGPPSLRTAGLLIVATSNSDRFKVFQGERFRVAPAVYLDSHADDSESHVTCSFLSLPRNEPRTSEVSESTVWNQRKKKEEEGD